ncbi:MAG: zinc ABC transporter substrate-binding protein [Anaerolineaceae bacterium]|nr:zinc ABC transporter substrate-binding protein [Anaerolineaceae bacterium]
MSINNKLLGISLVLILIFTGCAPNSNTEISSNDGKIIVSASIMPQKYLIERITGDQVEVNIMVGPGESPHTYEPTPGQMKILSQSSLYFTIGVEFETIWLEKMTSVSPDMRVVHTEDGLEKIPLQDDHQHEDESGDHDEDSEILDPHIWLSPDLVSIQAESIFQAISELDPQNTETYRENLNQFQRELQEVSAQIKETLTIIEQREFIVFHPSWGYFARDFDLQQIPIEVGGSEPSPKELAALITYAQEHNIQVIFASPTFNPKTAEIIASEINGEVLMIDPLAENWMDNLQKVSQTFSSVLAP